MRIPTLIAATIIALSISAASPATAKPTDPMDDLVAAALEATPGGTRTGWNEVAWDDGDIVLTLADPATRTGATAKAVGGCASGKFCAYTLPGYLGNKLTFSTCTSNHGVSALGGSVRSIANSRSSGTVKAYNGSSLVLSVSAGTGKIPRPRSRNLPAPDNERNETLAQQIDKASGRHPTSRSQGRRSRLSTDEGE